MRARAVAAIALSGALALGLTGCNILLQPQTANSYDPSDGVGLDIGQLELRNVLVLTEDGKTGSLVGAAVNTTGSDLDFTVQWSVGGSYHEVQLTARAHTTTRFGAAGDQIALTPLGEQAGGLLDAVVHTSTDQRALSIPVLDGTFVEYQDELPTQAPAKK